MNSKCKNVRIPLNVGFIVNISNLLNRDYKKLRVSTFGANDPGLILENVWLDFDAILLF